MMRTVEDIYDEYRHLPNHDEWPISASTAQHIATLQYPASFGTSWLIAAWRGEATLIGIPVRIVDQ